MLWKTQLFANRVKTEFAQEGMDFLGHILSREGVKPEPKANHGQRVSILLRPS
jgi:hypothetical protein